MNCWGRGVLLSRGKAAQVSAYRSPGTADGRAGPPLLAGQLPPAAPRLSRGSWSRADVLIGTAIATSSVPDLHPYRRRHRRCPHLRCAFLRLLEARYSGFTIDREPRTTSSHRARASAADVPPEADVPRLAGRPAVDARARRFLRRVGSGLAPGAHPAVREPVLDRRVLRIVHTLVLAREGGFLVHAASAVRNGRAFSSPVSPALGRRRSPAWRRRTPRCSPTSCPTCAGNGTDTAPTARRSPESWQESARTSARRWRRCTCSRRVPRTASTTSRGGRRPGAAGQRPVLRQGLRARAAVFHSACELVERVPVRRLTFLPDARVWELIQ